MIIIRIPCPLPSTLFFTLSKILRIDLKVRHSDVLCRDNDMSDSLCTICGACCAIYRVSFYWGELADADGNGVPHELSVDINSRLSCMKGTRGGNSRCIALQGELGESVSCAIYEHRPSACRDVTPHDPRCLRARAAYGMGSCSGVKF